MCVEGQILAGSMPTGTGKRQTKAAKRWNHGLAWWRTSENGD